MRRTLFLFIFFNSYLDFVFSQCNPPLINLDAIPTNICESSDTIHLKQILNTGIFFLNSKEIDKIVPADLGPGNFLLSYNLLYDSLCSTVSKTKLFKIEPKLDITIDSDTLNCFNKEVTLQTINSIPNSNFQWFGPDGFYSEKIITSTTTSGDYFLNVSNDACNASASFTVFENFEPPSEISTNGGTIDCIVGGTKIFAKTKSNNSSYFWIGPGGFSSEEQSPFVFKPGTYFVNIVDVSNGCSLTKSVEVSSPEIPDLKLSGSGLLTCKDTLVILNAKSTCDSCSFLWVDPDLKEYKRPEIEVKTPGIYYVEVFNSLGCYITDSIEVKTDYVKPDVTINNSGNLLTCSLTNINLSANPKVLNNNLSYEWYFDEDPIFFSFRKNVSIAKGGTYTLVSKDRLNGCSSKKSIEIQMDTTPPEIFIQLVKPFCKNSKAILSGNGTLTAGESTFFWFDKNPTDIPFSKNIETEIQKPGTYYLSVQDKSNNCVNIDSIQVKESDSFPANISFKIKQPGCLGNNGLLNIEGADISRFRININNKWYDTTRIFKGFSEGIQKVKINDVLGCDYDTSVVFRKPPDFNILLKASSSNLNQGDDFDISVIANVPSDEIKSIVWKKNNVDINCILCFKLSEEAIQSVHFKADALTIDGCKASSDILLFVRRNTDVYFGDAFSPNGDGINDYFKPYFGKSIKNASFFKIFDRWGNPLYQENIENLTFIQGWDGKVNGNSLPLGVYVFFLQVEYIDGRKDIISDDFSLLR